MKLNEIKNHWTEWAQTYGKDIRATDKSKTKKFLEINALAKAIRKNNLSTVSGFKILEAGCGNGYNCLALAREFKTAQVLGFDYIPEMITNAKALKEESMVENVNYIIGDALKLDEVFTSSEVFDFIFTNRFVINLNTYELQTKIVTELARKVKVGGYLILSENPQKKFLIQNKLRNELGLESRECPSFNLFIDEDSIINTITNQGFKHLYSDDFSALHDLFLYVLLPKLNNGEIDYDNPMLEIINNLTVAGYEICDNPFGHFGQNRLYVFEKMN